MEPTTRQTKEGFFPIIVTTDGSYMFNKPYPSEETAYGEAFRMFTELRIVVREKLRRQSYTFKG